MKTRSRSHLMTLRPIRCGFFSRTGFSLMELLVVMAVIAILVALAATGLKGSLPAAKLNSAGNMVVELLGQARQHATARNTPVMFVAAKNDDGDYQYFSLLELPLDSSAWERFSRWEKLPVGITIDPAKSRLDPPPVSIVPPPPPSLKRGPQTLTLSDSEYAWQVFLPGGNLLGGETPVYHLRATEGSSAFYQISVIAATGHTLIDRP